AVTDHSEWLATDYGCTVDSGSPFYAASYCTRLRNLRNPPIGQRPCLGFKDLTGSGCRAEQTTAWGAENAATESANDPCTFTTFHAYEWTFALSPQGDPQQDKQTLHKNVLFRNANVPAVPLDALDYPTSPTLWAALAEQCTAANGCEALTIPHNMNQSNGLAFALGGYTAPDLNRMMKFQRLAEIHQHKASSECLTDTADSGAARPSPPAGRRFACASTSTSAAIRAPIQASPRTWCRAVASPWAAPCRTWAAPRASSSTRSRTRPRWRASTSSRRASSPETP